MTLSGQKTDRREGISTIQVCNRQKRHRIHRDAVVRFCEALLQALNLQGRPLSVVFIGTGAMRILNRRYRGKDYATDVLSFSYGNEVVEGWDFWGEIVIAPEVAARQADWSSGSVEREIRTLLLHGALHLAGYDHETDCGQMLRLQKKLQRRKFFCSPELLADRKARS